MKYAKLNSSDVCVDVFEFDIDVSDMHTIIINNSENADNLIGMKYNRVLGKFEKTDIDKLSETQLTIMEAMAEQYEESLNNRLNDMEVQATIYEAVLALSEGGETE